MKSGSSEGPGELPRGDDGLGRVRRGAEGPGVSACGSEEDVDAAEVDV